MSTATIPANADYHQTPHPDWELCSFRTGDDQLTAAVIYLGELMWTATFDKPGDWYSWKANACAEIEMRGNLEGAIPVDAEGWNADFEMFRVGFNSHTDMSKADFEASYARVLAHAPKRARSNGNDAWESSVALHAAFRAARKEV